ncbi:MAG: L-threonylcarbamoyladenylate synthase [Cuniculiplasma sp.]
MSLIIRIQCNNMNEEKLRPGVETLKSGGTVVFPTETVYGLGADATSDDACMKIFNAKGRPVDNPLIVHFSDISDLDKYTYWSHVAKRKELERLWPGPLTVIVKKKDLICDTASAGLPTVGVRIPDCNFSRELIRRCGSPVAAPSANVSGRPSATSIDHILEELGHRVDIMYSAESPRYGIESTVILPEGNKCTILRPGAYTEEDLLKIFDSVGYARVGEKVMSPGMKYRHYSPEKILFRASPDRILQEIAGKNDLLPIVSTELGEKINGKKLVLGSVKDPISISSNLYKCLRELDRSSHRGGIIEAFPEVGYFVSVMNRVKKASIELE